MNFKDMLEKISQLSEATKDTGKGKIHTADAGGYGRKYDTDEEGEEVKKKDKESAVKRGKGRPKKGADDSGEVKKYDSSALSKAMGGGKMPKKEVGKTSVKHTLKDWFEHMEAQMLSEAGLAVQPIPAQKSGQAYLIKDPANPAAAAITTSDPAVVNAAKKGTMSMQKPGATSSTATPSSTQVAPLEEKDIGKHNNATTGFDALVKKLTPKYGVEAAKRIAGSQLKKIKEADIPSMSGVDTEGANLGAGRSQTTLESRVKKDDKAEKAGKKVTKDIEYDEKVKDKIHGKKRGAEDAKAERAGKKVAKDIEYDMKKKTVKEAAKPDYIDLDKDGDKKESMKKAAADKKKKAVKEGISHNISAARLEGKSHALSKMPYSCRHHGMEECRAYHEGFKEGLDECYGQMPVQGMIGETDAMPAAAPAATTPGMASQAQAGGISESSSSDGAKSAVTNRILRMHSDILAKYGPVKVMAAIDDACDHLHDLEEIGSSDVSAWVNNVIRGLKSGAYDSIDEDALDEVGRGEYMKQKAKSTPGDTFKAFGQTMHDKDVLEDDFAFEAWDKELQNLLTESEQVDEGLTVSVSKGQQGSPDSVSINASDAEADQVLAFIKQAGLGLFGDEGHSENLPVAVGGEPAEIGSAAPHIDVVDDHEGMMALMKKMTGGDTHAHDHGGSEDYADEEGSDMCDECGMMECGCGGNQMVDEVESEDQMEFKVAEGNPPDNGSANSTNDEQGNAAANQALATADAQQNADDKQVNIAEEGEEDAEDSADAEEEEDSVEESLKLDEWANDAGPGKSASDTTFEQDIDYMMNVISSGLNKRKSTGQTTVPVVSTQLNRLHSHNTTDVNESVTDWQKLAGIK